MVFMGLHQKCSELPPRLGQQDPGPPEGRHKGGWDGSFAITEPDASQWRLEVGGTFPGMLSRSWATSRGDVESQGGADPWGHTHPWRVA